MEQEKSGIGLAINQYIRTTSPSAQIG